MGKRASIWARIGAVGIVAAFAAFAYLVAPADAGAAVLCEANQESCENTKVHPPELVARSTNPIFNFGGLGTVKCESIKIEASGNATEEKVNNFWVTKCGEGCTISPQNLPYKVELASTSGGNETVTLKNSGKGTPSFSAQCGEVKCVYNAEGMQATFTGGEPATMQMNQSLTPETESFFCTKSTLEGTFEVTRPSPSAFVSSSLAPLNAGEGMICKVKELVCASKNAYGIEFSGSNDERETMLKFGSGEAQRCGSTTFTTYAAKVSGLNFVGRCSGSCEIRTEQFLPYNMNLRVSGRGNGRISFGRGGKRPFAFKTEGCLGGVCEYAASEQTEVPFVGGGELVGTQRIQIRFQEMPLNRTSGGEGCPETAYFSAYYRAPTAETLLYTEYAKAPNKTVLCKANENPCKETSIVSKFNGKLKEGTTATFKTGNEIVEETCKGGEMGTGEMSSKEGQVTASGTVETFKFSECSSPGGGCTMATSGGFTLSTEALGTGNGTVWTEGGSGSTVTLTCFSNVCKYGPPIAETLLVGGEPGDLKLSALLPLTSGSTFVCRTSLTLADEYQTTQSPLFVSRR